MVTSLDQAGAPVGMTMSAVTSLSLDPPEFLVCMDRRTVTLKAIRASRVFCINVLSEDQMAISNLFAQPHTVDKFAGVKFRKGKLGAPVLAGTIAHVECQLVKITRGGDHGMVIGLAMHGSVPGGRPLGHFDREYRRLPEGD